MKRTLALAAALAAFPLTLSSAALAAPEPTPGAGITASPQTYRQNTELKAELGGRSAGSYLGADGELVTTVTSEADAALVRAEGAEPRLVERSGAELRGAQQTLTETSIPGTSVGIDPRRNQVVVEADSTVSKADLARLQRAAAAQDGAVRLVRIPGVFKEEIAGGDAIYGGGYRCSSAFNVSSGSTRYFVTAGHCTNAATDWRATSGGAVIGQRHGTSYPTNDYGIVRYTDGSSPSGNVNLYNGSHQDITSAADPVVGQAVRKSGSTTKVTSGTVTATDVTVNYGSGNIAYGMVRTTVCSAGGDSGGAHFSGSTALGIHSGSGGCTDGVNGSAIFQPVREALSAYGVNVY